tara:strand:+ start:207 stop:374 length:168 start_codon:yes stop_codon:yes gene_type:complete
MKHFFPESYRPIFLYDLDDAEKVRRARRAADTAQHQADRLRAVADEMEAALREGS